MLSYAYPKDLKPIDDYPNTWLLQAPLGGVCVATAVGPRSLLTAAHCVMHGTTYTLHQGAGPELQARCTQSPNYVPPTSPLDCSAPATRANDVAVCTVEGDNTLPNPGGKFETIDARTPNPVGRVKVVTFWGCPPDSATSSINAIEMTVASWPLPQVREAARASDSAAGNLCGGDSGSPWMAQEGAVPFVAIHVCRGGSTTSRAVALDRDEVVSFLVSQQGQSTPICGVTPQASPCR